MTEAISFKTKGLLRLPVRCTQTGRSFLTPRNDGSKLWVFVQILIRHTMILIQPSFGDGSPVFRGKYIHYLKKAYKNNELVFPGQTAYMGTASGFKALLNSCYACDWVVDIRDPIDQPEYVLEYLARYTHRVAISNNRILSLEDGKVTFTYKNRDTGQTEQTTIDAVEFIRRFLLN